eukprot:1130455-Pyramimonas_sp.AAC.1
MEMTQAKEGWAKEKKYLDEQLKQQRVALAESERQTGVADALREEAEGKRKAAEKWAEEAEQFGRARPPRRSTTELAFDGGRGETQLALAQGMHSPTESASL